MILKKLENISSFKRQSGLCRCCTTPGSWGCRDVEWFPLLWECMCALWDPVEPWSGIKWDPWWSSKCHVPTRPLNQTYWFLHTTSCPNWDKGQINISSRDWPQWAGKVTRGEQVRDTAPGFDRREESVVMVLGCGLWMYMSCKRVNNSELLRRGSCLFFPCLPHAAMPTVDSSTCRICSKAGGKERDTSFCADWKSSKMWSSYVPKIYFNLLKFPACFLITILSWLKIFLFFFPINQTKYIIKNAIISKKYILLWISFLLLWVPT